MWKAWGRIALKLTACLSLGSNRVPYLDKSQVRVFNSYTSTLHSHLVPTICLPIAYNRPLPIITKPLCPLFACPSPKTTKPLCPISACPSPITPNPPAHCLPAHGLSSQTEHTKLRAVSVYSALANLHGHAYASSGPRYSDMVTMSCIVLLYCTKVRCSWEANALLFAT